MFYLLHDISKPLTHLLTCFRKISNIFNKSVVVVYGILSDPFGNNCMQ